MANYTTGSQRYNARMDKIFEEAKRLKAEEMKNPEWSCSKATLGNNEWECESKRGNAISMNANGSIRFTKFECDTPVKINGKIFKKGGKDFCGVELN